MPPTTPTDSSVLTRLRAETRNLHLALEAQLDIASPAFDLARYATLIVDFHGFYAAIEPAVPFYRAAQSTLPGPRADRRKLPLLREDLAWLGYAAAAIEDLPRCAELPSLDGGPAQLGCAYVLEGSTLGGQSVLRHLGPRLGVSASAGARFFNSYGRDVGAMWKTFLAELEERCASDAARDAAVRAAADTFRCLHRWLTRER